MELLNDWFRIHLTTLDRACTMCPSCSTTALAEGHRMIEVSTNPYAECAGCGAQK